MTETSEGYEARHREAAGYLEQHKPAPSSPTGETPGSVSATSDGRVAGNTPQLQSAPTGETAGQGEWVRAKSAGQQRWAVSPEGVEYGSVIWSGPHGEAAIVPLAVEQAIRASVEPRIIVESRRAAEARATAAEAERDRLREALRYASEQAHTYMGLIHARSFARCNQEPCITRRALAGESTGEQP